MMQKNNEPAIKSIHVLATGNGSQHKEHRFGSWKPSLWWVLTSRSWVEIPILVYVIEHRDGLILFDAGMSLEVQTDPEYFSTPIGRFFARKIFRFNIGSNDTLTDKLSKLGYKASDIRKVVVSHLHFDHIGCINEAPQAELLVSAREWQQLAEPHPERDFILREHIELPGAKWLPIEFQHTNDPLFLPFGGCFDVMGDGSMVLLPTPGHTVGSLSMLVRSGDYPPLLFVGDLTYASELLFKNQMPGTGDRKALQSSFEKVRNLKKQLPDLVILPAHDSKAVDALAKARS